MNALNLSGRPGLTAGRTTAGYTLIEALVVLGILGVLLGLAAPSYLGWIQRQRVAAGTQDIAQAVERARSFARRDGVCATFRLLSDTSYQIERFTTKNCTGTTEVQTTALPDGTSVTLSAGGATAVQFIPPYGTNLSSQPLDFKINSGKVARQLRITGVMGTVVSQ